MDFEYRNGKQVTETVNLITTILYRYSEVSTINYHPAFKSLKFSFLLSKKISDIEFHDIKQLLLDSIEVFNLLEKRKPKVININCQYINDYTMLEIERDLCTLVQGEILLTVLNLQHLVKNNIIIEKAYDDKADEEMQEDIIDSMMLKAKNSKGDLPLLAFREEGRVLVFNM